jgi:hypothetical protein
VTAAAAALALVAAPVGGADPSGGASAPPSGKSERLAPARGPSDPGAPGVMTGVSSRVAYVDGARLRFSYRIDGSEPAAVSVSVVNLSDGRKLKTWNRNDVKPGHTRHLTWNAHDNDRPAHDGRYAFRLAATGSTGATARNAADRNQSRDAFDLHGYVFPLHAHHKYGDGFGAPRGGHTHQGQDVFASCGTPIIAPRGGKVKASKYQSAAGNYVVIDGADTGYDFFFAHMRKRSPLRVGDRVLTGQKIGNVGDTGDAVGCHLHFEMWTPPGWYTGGHAFDPAPFLRRWDKYS